MQFSARIFHFVAITFLALCGAACLALTDFLGTNSATEAVPVPVEAEWAISVDALGSLQSELYTLLFEAKDQELITAIEALVEKRSDERNEKGALAIDLTHAPVLYSIRENGQQFFGLLLHVSDPEAFNANIPRYLNDHQAAALNGNTALILTAFSTETPNKKQLAKHAKKYINSTNRLLFAKLGRPEAPVVLRIPGDPHSIVRGYYNDHALSLEGTFSLPETFHPSSYTLKSTGLFISSSILPAGFSDSIAQFLPLGDYRLPPLSSITLDYRGVSVEQSSQGIMALPAMNLILASESVLSVDSMLTYAPDDLKGSDHTLQLGNVTYQLRQLDAHTVFIGIDPSAIVQQQPTCFLDIHGSLAPLLNISGSRFLLAFLDVFPAYKAGKGFITGTQRINLRMSGSPQVTQEGNYRYFLEGRVVFKEGYYPLHEVSRLLVGFGVLD